MDNITIRPARPGEIAPALALALRVFMMYSAPLYKRKAIRHFCKTLKDKEGIRSYESGNALMLIARDGEKPVGVAAASWRRADKISLLYVDPAYHRRSIATKLMDTLIAAMGVPKVTLGSSTHGVPFYLKYGFVPTDAEQHKHGAIWQPMEYTAPVAITIRPARPEEIAPALDLAQRVYQEFIRPGKNTAANYDGEHETMLVALAGERIVGMASQRGGCHIRKLYVDGAWHRRGIAAGLMDAIIQSMGAPRVTVNSSSYAMPFYLHYGFVQMDKELNHDGLIFTPMAYTVPITIRPARPEDVRPALDFAQRIFEEYVLPDFEPPACERLGLHMDTEEQIQAYQEGRWAMFVALAGERIVGMACERDGCHIRKLYVDGAWHRRGIATKLMDAIFQSMGARRITINSSRFALRFYEKYGFKPTDTEQNKDGFVFTPMVFTPSPPAGGAPSGRVNCADPPRGSLGNSSLHEFR